MAYCILQNIVVGFVLLYLPGTQVLLDLYCCTVVGISGQRKADCHVVNCVKTLGKVTNKIIKISYYIMEYFIT